MSQHRTSRQSLFDARFFDAVVYFRPRYLHWRRMRPLDSPGAIFYITVFTTETPRKRRNVDGNNDAHTYDDDTAPDRSKLNRSTYSSLRFTSKALNDDLVSPGAIVDIASPIVEVSESRLQQEEEEEPINERGTHDRGDESVLGPSVKRAVVNEKSGLENGYDSQISG